jgi:outer membrane protein assembly factor BamA
MNVMNLAELEFPDSCLDIHLVSVAPSSLGILMKRYQLRKTEMLNSDRCQWTPFLAAGYLCLVLLLSPFVNAQTAGEGTAPLREVKSDGQKILSEGQIAALTELKIGAQVGRGDLQNAADILVTSGLFSTVQYDFKTRAEGLTLTFHLTESPRVPVYYDNFPWFGDSELNDAVRSRLPFFDGTLPEAGSVVEAAASGIHDLLTTHKLDLPVQHQVIGNPIGDGNVQQFSVEGAGLKIASMSFSDAALTSNPAVQQHLSEINGKPYSRTTIDLFLAEQIRPVYLKQGYLKAKLGPPEVRLSGPPAAKLPDQIPVFVPITTGDIYHFADVQWTGNNAISSISLASYFGLKPGVVADGMEIEGALDKISEQYGGRGYLDATVQPETSFNEAAHTVSYKIAIVEGTQYHMSGWVITGLSANGEARVRSQFPLAAGDVFDKIKYEDFLRGLQSHSKDIFGELPVHYDNVGHWLRPDPAKATVDVLLDFK